MSATVRPFRLIALATLLLVVGSCVSPKGEAERVLEMQQVGDAINEMRNVIQELQGTTDSLRLVVTKQDTTLARLANVTGVVVVK